MADASKDVASNPQAQMQALSRDYQKIQDDLSNAVQTRQKLSSQQSENLSVQKEFAKLKDENTIYKLVGPVLMKQEHSEAKMAVDGRLGWIGGELKRTEERISELQQKAEGVKMEIIQLQQLQQSQQQQMQQGQAQAGAVTA